MIFPVAMRNISLTMSLISSDKHDRNWIDNMHKYKLASDQKLMKVTISVVDTFVIFFKYTNYQ